MQISPPKGTASRACYTRSAPSTTDVLRNQILNSFTSKPQIQNTTPNATVSISFEGFTALPQKTTSPIFTNRASTSDPHWKPLPLPPIHQTPRPIRTLLSRNSLLLPFILPLIQTQPKISNHDLINLKLGLIKLNQSQIGRLDALRQLPYPKQEFLKSIFQMKFLKGVNPFTRTSSLALFSQRCPLIKPLRMSSTFFGVKELSWRYTPILLNAQ